MSPVLSLMYILILQDVKNEQYLAMSLLAFHHEIVLAGKYSLIEAHVLNENLASGPVLWYSKRCIHRLSGDCLDASQPPFCKRMLYDMTGKGGLMSLRSCGKKCRFRFFILPILIKILNYASTVNSLLDGHCRDRLQLSV